MSLKYQRPEFLNDKVKEEETYQRWLERKARAHVSRDKQYGNHSANISAYKQAIHEAVIRSQGKDAYTGDDLRWDLLCTFSNDQASIGKREYKKEFALLPTVDHVHGRMGTPIFNICSWRTNDAKGDMSTAELISLCKKIIQHSGES